MTKAELIERIARSRDLPPEITKKEVAQILGIAFEELAAYFARAKVTRTSSPRFTFPRFGTFTKKRRSARRGVNPRTLEPIHIDAFHTIDFKASRELRESMNRPNEVAPVGSKQAETSGATAASPKRAAKGSAGRANKKATRAAAPELAIGGRRRKLTPRDEEAELDALLGDTSVFDEGDLPGAPVQRVRKASKSKSRTG